MALVETRQAAKRLTEKDFLALPFTEKSSYLKNLTAKEKMNLILADPDAKRLTASLEPQEFFRVIKEIGETDAVELLPLASADQRVFLLDMELWEGSAFSEEKAIEWLSYFVESGEPAMHELLKHLDFEFLQLLLGRELIVGGGIGDQENDEERLGDYDHSFDGVFMLKFKNPKHSRLIGSFVSMIMKLDNPLYTALMEGIKGDVDLELEEQCLRFRNGRLEDLGFPPFDEAISIYARVNPDTFELQLDKAISPASEEGHLVTISTGEDTLLFKALTLAGEPILLQELNYLVNSALVAEGKAFHEQESMTGVMQRVLGYLNIALEKLAPGDEQRAAEILKGEELKRLFQLGFSIVLELKFLARDMEVADYASAKLVGGLKTKRPRFYRGLDPDGVDGYREFANLADVERAAEVLSRLNS